MRCDEERTRLPLSLRRCYVGEVHLCVPLRVCVCLCDYLQERRVSAFVRVRVSECIRVCACLCVFAYMQFVRSCARTCMCGCVCVISPDSVFGSTVIGAPRVKCPSILSGARCSCGAAPAWSRATMLVLPWLRATSRAVVPD